MKKKLTQEALRTMKPEEMHRLVLAIYDKKYPGARNLRKKAS